MVEEDVKARLSFYYPLLGDKAAYEKNVQENISRDREKWDQWFLAAGLEIERACPKPTNCPRFSIEKYRRMKETVTEMINIYRLRVNKEGNIIGCTHPTFGAGDPPAETVIHKLPELPDTGIEEIFVCLQLFDSQDSLERYLKELQHPSVSRHPPDPFFGLSYP